TTFDTLYGTDKNVFIGSSPGSGKTVCAELAILRMFKVYGDKAKCLYICPRTELLKQRRKEWRATFSMMCSAKVVLLTGDYQHDLALIRAGNTVVAFCFCPCLGRCA